MTRTARSAFPRAVNRDRSESKSGLDKSIRKNGAGPHSWGSLADEQDLEYAALNDEDYESGTEKSEGSQRKQSLERSLSEEDMESAKQSRKNALKKGLDLSAIARTSVAVSTSPPVKASPLTTNSTAI